MTLHLDAFPDEVRFERLFHDRPRQIVITWANWSRNRFADVFSPTLQEITEASTYWGFIAVDLDGDGTKEIINTECCDRRPCAMGILMHVDRFDGHEFKPAQRYLDMHTFSPGERTEWTLALPQDKSSFRLHIVPLGGAHGTISIDGNRVAHVWHTMNVPLSLDSDCPSMRAAVSGPPGAAIWVFVADH